MDAPGHPRAAYAPPRRRLLGGETSLVHFEKRYRRRDGATLWTQDAHFDGLPGVRYFSKT